MLTICELIIEYKKIFRLLIVINRFFKIQNNHYQYIVLGSKNKTDAKVFPALSSNRS